MPKSQCHRSQKAVCEPGAIHYPGTLAAVRSIFLFDQSCSILNIREGGRANEHQPVLELYDAQNLSSAPIYLPSTQRSYVCVHLKLACFNNNEGTAKRSISDSARVP